MHSPTHESGATRSGRLSRGWLLALPAALALVCGCPTAKMEEELKKEIQAVKAEVQAVKEKLAEVQAGQKAILTALQMAQAMPKPAAPPPGLAPAPPGMGMPAPGLPPATAGKTPEMAGELTVSELVKSKDKYLGQRVTVKGEPGPVLVHKRVFHLRAPEGMVEVIFANLADKAQIERLTSQVLPGELKVTGVLVQASGQGPSRLQISAEAVEF